MVFTTFNEALVFCQSGYSQGEKAPAIKAPGKGEYLCSHNLLLSHATMYRLYDEVYKPKFKGIIGITLNSLFYYKKNLNDSDAIIDRAIQFNFGIFMHPIFSKQGGWPPVMVEDIARNSKAEGRNWSRLPEFTDAQKKFVRGTADFLGFNYYTSRLVEYDEKFNVSAPPTWEKDTRIVESVDPKWPKSKAMWLCSVPQGLRDVLR
jgi:beta-glucosidase/6-phospho-beta-glucosidase/beta-galactosidase